MKTPTVSDPVFEQKMNDAWSECRRFWQSLRAGKASKEEDPQRIYAREFFQYYLENPATGTGDKAAQHAFIMWGNLGEVAEVDQAISEIDPAFPEWEIVIHGARNAYARAGRIEDVLGLLRNLEDRVLHPKSKSAVWMSFADFYRHRGDHETARMYLEQVVTEHADLQHLHQAKGHLYEITSLGVGQPAPDFSAETIDGTPIILSQFRGKVVLLEFWSTSCGPCIPELAHLKRIHAEHSESDLQLIGISRDMRREDLDSVINQEHVGWLQIWEVVQRGEIVQLGEIASLYNVWGVPQSYVVDQEGRIVRKGLRRDDLERAVRELVGKSRG